MPARRICPGLYVIPVGPVNTFLLDSPDGCVLIDTGFPNSENTILKAIQQLGKRSNDIRHIVLTHAHPDHIGGDAGLRRASAVFEGNGMGQVIAHVAYRTQDAIFGQAPA